MIASNHIRAAWVRSRCKKVGRDLRVTGRVWIHGSGSVILGDRVVLDGTRGPIELHACDDGELVLGDDVHIEGGASIEVIRSVLIGARSVVGAWTKVLDNDFHPLRGMRHVRPESNPVQIGPDVQIGERCVILPGARLESGVTLGPCVVIGRRVPAGTRLEGSPPRRAATGAVA